MKKNLNSLLLIAAGLVVLSVATPAYAQPNIMRVSIPFAFVAGNHAYQAGDYWVRLNSEFRLADLRATDENAISRVSLAGPRMNGKPAIADKGYLKFNRYGDSYFLAGVWPRGAMEGMGVIPSKAESELAKTHGGGAAAETIIQSVR